ncbi:MAG: hypothetical protein V9H69_11180 [Anaerolineae bacterium]
MPSARRGGAQPGQLTPTRSACRQDGAAAGDVRSQFVNLADADLKPAGWDSLSQAGAGQLRGYRGLRDARARLQHQRQRRWRRPIGARTRPSPTTAPARIPTHAVRRHEPPAAAPGRPG